MVGLIRAQRSDPGLREAPAPEATASLELSDDQLERVVGGLVRPALNPQQLTSLLQETEFSSNS